MKYVSLLIALSMTGNMLCGQIIENQMQPPVNSEIHPCISQEEYKEMEIEVRNNLAMLGSNSRSVLQKGLLSTSLIWPLRTSTNLKDCGYYYISAFVDLDPGSGLKDWNCGTRTYNGHRGVDIVPWPFIWDKMDHNQVEVIAAASGIIIAKIDGNPDRICNGVGGGGNSNNYIIVQHADSSTALYVHLKSGSFTSKTVGQTVMAGEYLGIVGSAGQSTGAHLHFEFRTEGSFGSYVDPFFGSCNGGISSSLWADQRPYKEPQINKLSLHSSWPYMAVCPNTTDTLYQQDTFISRAGAEATFHVCTKHVQANDEWTFRVLYKDKTVFNSWKYTSASTRNTSTIGWSKKLPTIPGDYIFEGTFNSITCSTPFTILGKVGMDEGLNGMAKIKLYPNPAQGTLFVDLPENFLNSEQPILGIFDVSGRLAHEQKLDEKHTRLPIVLSQGLYYFVVNHTESVAYGKFYITK